MSKREPERIEINDPDLAERFEQSREEAEAAWLAWGQGIWEAVRDASADVIDEQDRE